MMVRCWWIAFFAAMMVNGGLYAGDQNIGDFDIEKVRNAVRTNDSSINGTASDAVVRESVTSLVLRITLYLGIVIVMIAGIAWLVKRGGIGAVRGGGGAMDIVETLPVGQNRMLIMVRVMDEIYLVAQTSSAITLLDKIGGQKALDIIASSKGGGTILRFRDAFDHFLGKIKKPV
jgi:flagellar biosynthetic protein FliO